MTGEQALNFAMEVLTQCLPLVTDRIDDPETGKKEKSAMRALETRVRFAINGCAENLNQEGYSGKTPFRKVKRPLPPPAPPKKQE